MKRSAERFVRQRLVENEPVAPRSLALPLSCNGKNVWGIKLSLFLHFTISLLLSGTKYLIMIFAGPLQWQQDRRWAFRSSSSYLSRAVLLQL